MRDCLPKILISGGQGQLAQALCHHLSAANFQLIACSHQEMDITDVASINQCIEQYMPDKVINAAAYTAVDKAEKEIDSAMQINHLGARNLALVCQKQSIPLIHISTDYIFDGYKNIAYLENDAANPINAYGQSKYLGEETVRRHCEQHLILRISGIFSEYGHNFLKTILRLIQEKKELNIVADQITCPTYAGDVATTILNLAKQKIVGGTYHYCSAESISWYQFAVAIVAEAKKYKSLAVENILPIPAATYLTAAKRPAYSVLNCDKIKTDFNILQPALPKGITQVVSTLLSNGNKP